MSVKHYKSILCPECGSPARAVDSVVDLENNEVYRQKSCTNPDCRYFFYTMEFEVESNQELIETWNKYRRRNKYENVR